MANYSQRSRGFRFIWSQKTGYFGNLKFLDDHFKIEGIDDFQKKFLEEWRHRVDHSKSYEINAFEKKYSNFYGIWYV